MTMASPMLVYNERHMGAIAEELYPPSFSLGVKGIKCYEANVIFDCNGRRGQLFRDVLLLASY